MLPMPCVKHVVGLIGGDECGVTSAGVPGAGEGAGLHGQKLCCQRGCCRITQALMGGSGEVGGLGEGAEIGGLMAHRGHDAARERPVCGGLGHAQGLDENSAVPGRADRNRRMSTQPADGR
jgi:hypothetical protein